MLKARSDFPNVPDITLVEILTQLELEPEFGPQLTHYFKTAIVCEIISTSTEPRLIHPSHYK